MINYPPKIINAGLLAVIIVLLLGIVFAVRAGISNLYYFKVDNQMILWEKEAFRPPVEWLAEMQGMMKRATGLWPENAEYLQTAAQIEGWTGYELSRGHDNKRAVEKHYRQAVKLLRTSIAVRPAHATAWALLAEYKTLLGEKDDEWFTAREKALEFGGADPQLVNRMMRLY